MNKKGFTGLELIGAMAIGAIITLITQAGISRYQGAPLCILAESNPRSIYPGVSSDFFKNQWDGCLIQLEKEMQFSSKHSQPIH